MVFDDLVGQDHIRDILKNAVTKSKISHAYLFSGPRGTGKTSAARILGRAINCEDLKDGGPCNKCPICTSAIEESLTDLIEMDAASHTGVDDIRDGPICSNYS
jgi:DNA polymerase-3 subunit gamma/tau